MRSALIFIFQTFAELYLATFLIRFLLQWVRADYYNPLSQFIFRVTAPLVVPARRILPSVSGWDMPTLVVLVVLQLAETFFLDLFSGAVPTFGVLVTQAILQLVVLLLRLYVFAIFLYALMSLLGDRGHGPMASVLGSLVRPVLNPIRRVLPPIGGFDLSPLIALVALQAIVIALGSP